MAWAVSAWILFLFPGSPPHPVTLKQHVTQTLPNRGQKWAMSWTTLRDVDQEHFYTLQLRKSNLKDILKVIFKSKLILSPITLLI